MIIKLLSTQSPYCTELYIIEGPRLLTLPKLEIDKFNGDPQMYLSFCAIFDEAVDSVTDNDKIKIKRLLQFTYGTKTTNTFGDLH